MFSSTSTNDRFQHHPYSFRAPSHFVGQNGDVFIHHDDDLLAGQFFSANAPVIETVNTTVSSPEAAFPPQNIKGLDGVDRNTSSLPSRKKPVRKDRHSKIFTAQGPRDRRVRLSIEVSRKFFALQDMLGFDKASKTLDWLFTKSKAAISELVQMKYSRCGGAKSLSSTSECEVLSGGTNETTDTGDTKGLDLKNNPLDDVAKEKKKRQSHKAAFHFPAKESRAKARARARARTREKMCVKEQDESKKVPDFRRRIQNQSSSCCNKLGTHSHDIHPSKVNTDVTEPNCFPRLVNHASGQDMIDESIMIKRKAIPSPIFGSQENPVIFKDVNSDDSNYYPHTIAGSGMSDLIRYQTFSATSNMNPSTVLQICSKPWDVYKSHGQQ